MDKTRLISYLEGMDRALASTATHYIYGSAACILLDEPDRSDIQYLLMQSPTALSDIEAAVARLPVLFARDPLVRENLENLRADMSMWGMRA
jgi:hypothetical protein